MVLNVCMGHYLLFVLAPPQALQEIRDAREREQCTCTSESLHHPNSFQHCGLALPVVVMLIHMHMKVSVHPFCKQFKNQGLVWHLVISTLI